MNALMLLMADRRYESSPGVTTQRASGAHPEYGLGKIRMRSFDSTGGLGAWGVLLYSLSFTSAGSWGTTLLPTPLPTGATIAKCVVFHAEDMSVPKDDISHLNYYMRAWLPGPGGTCTGMSQYTAEQSDNTFGLLRRICGRVKAAQRVRSLAG
jgi:hypothetical protein